MTKYNYKCSECGSKEIKQNLSAVNSMKNILANDNKGGCCNGEDVCDINCKPDKKEESSCGCGGCC